MSEDLLVQAGFLGDSELLAHIENLARHERQSTAILVAYLSELAIRQLYLEEGYASLFVYCTNVLHLSEQAAYNRVEAAHAARRFPVILDLLAEGSVHLTTVRLLAPHLTGQNHRALLDAARHKSRAEVERLVAPLRPSTGAGAWLQRLPSRATPLGPSLRHDAVGGSATHPAAPTGNGAGHGRNAMSAVPLFEAIEPDETEGAEAAAIDPDEAEGARAAAIEAAEAEAFELEECGGLATAGGGGVPTGGGPAGPTDPPILYRLQVTLSEEAYVRLAQLRELMRHQVPDGDLAVIVDQALTRLLEHVQRRKFGKLAGRGKRRKQEA